MADNQQKSRGPNRYLKLDEKNVQKLVSMFSKDQCDLNLHNNAAVLKKTTDEKCAIEVLNKVTTSASSVIKKSDSTPNTSSHNSSISGSIRKPYKKQSIGSIQRKFEVFSTDNVASEKVPLKISLAVQKNVSEASKNEVNTDKSKHDNKEIVSSTLETSTVRRDQSKLVTKKKCELENNLPTANNVPVKNDTEHTSSRVIKLTGIEIVKLDTGTGSVKTDPSLNDKAELSPPLNAVPVKSFLHSKPTLKPKPANLSKKLQIDNKSVKENACVVEDDSGKIRNEDDSGKIRNDDYSLEQVAVTSIVSESDVTSKAASTHSSNDDELQMDATTIPDVLRAISEDSGLNDIYCDATSLSVEARQHERQVSSSIDELYDEVIITSNSVGSNSGTDTKEEVGLSDSYETETSSELQQGSNYCVNECIYDDVDMPPNEQKKDSKVHGDRQNVKRKLGSSRRKQRKAIMETLKYDSGQIDEIDVKPNDSDSTDSEGCDYELIGEPVDETDSQPMRQNSNEIYSDVIYDDATVNKAQSLDFDADTEVPKKPGLTQKLKDKIATSMGIFKKDQNHGKNRSINDERSCQSPCDANIQMKECVVIEGVNDDLLRTRSSSVPSISPPISPPIPPRGAVRSQTNCDLIRVSSTDFLKPSPLASEASQISPKLPPRNKADDPVLPPRKRNMSTECLTDLNSVIPPVSGLKEKSFKLDTYVSDQLCSRSAEDLASSGGCLNSRPPAPLPRIDLSSHRPPPHPPTTYLNDVPLPPKNIQNKESYVGHDGHEGSKRYLNLKNSERPKSDVYYDMNVKQDEAYLDMDAKKNEYLDMDKRGSGESYFSVDGRKSDYYMDMDRHSGESNESYIELNDSKIHVEKSTKTGNSPENKPPSTQRPFTGIWEMPSNKSHDTQYLEIVNDVTRLKRTMRYQSRFGEKAPLYQVYHKDYSSRKTLLRNPAQKTIDTKPSPLVADTLQIKNLNLTEDEEQPIYSDPAQEDDTDSEDDDFSSDEDDYSVDPASSRMNRLSASTMGLRPMWSEMPEVKKSGILDTMDAKHKKLQEAMFEVITSEASYLKSMHTFMNVFMFAPEFASELSTECIISRRDKHVLYSNMMAVMEESERLLADLESRWVENPVISDVCDLLAYHAENHFDVYVKYCMNQIYQLRILDELMSGSKVFAETVRRLQAHPDCHFLPLRSFLTLPMQRITRLPLLIDAILKRTEPESSLQQSATKAFQVIQNIVVQCNEGARSMERMEQMLEIDQQISFSKLKKVPLISSSRYLIKRGGMTRFLGESKSKFGSLLKKSNKNLYLFLFNDLLLVTTKKSEESYQVLDYCSRISLHTELIEDPATDRRLPHNRPSSCENTFILVLLENNEQKQVEFVLSVHTPSDRARWLEVLSPAIEDDGDEKIYEVWDSPQVQVLYPYEAQQPDELSLEQSDIIRVHRKMTDGWFEGERIRDGQKGWFPSNYTSEISNPRRRHNNLLQKHRLLKAAMTHLNKNY